MRIRKDLTGKRFGMLLVIRDVPEDSRYNHWLVRCDCGVENLSYAYALIKGATVSCGCQRGKVMAQKAITHGLSGTPTHKSWRNMLSRCGYNHCSAKHYAQRGIRVCERWQLFESFLVDMGERPEGHSLDRIDPNGNYEPGNCRWATNSEQARNKRRSITIEYNGVRKNLKDWADDLGIKYSVIHARWQKSHAPERVLRPLEVCTRWRHKMPPSSNTKSNDNT